MRPLLPDLPLCAARAQVAAPGAPLLSLSAPVGASVEPWTSTSSRLQLSEVKVSALPGRGVTQADLSRLQLSFNAGRAAPTTLRISQTGAPRGSSAA